MKVKDLMAMLNDLDPNAEVTLQKDEEGNGYRKANGVDGDFEFTTEYGDTYFLSSYECVEEMAEDLEDCDLLENLLPVVVIY